MSEMTLAEHAGLAKVILKSALAGLDLESVARDLCELLAGFDFDCLLHELTIARNMAAEAVTTE